jgi:hypothetical protein
MYSWSGESYRILGKIVKEKLGVLSLYLRRDLRQGLPQPEMDPVRRKKRKTKEDKNHVCYDQT